jgi:hypothetical protein
VQAVNGDGGAPRTHWQRPDAPLGTLIFREGLLSAEQLEESLGEAVKTGKRLGQVLVDKGLLQESQVARIIAKQKNLGFVDLAELEIDSATARLLPHETAWLHHALPIAVEDDVLVVAVEDPTDEEALGTVKTALGREARFVVATRSEILRILDELSSQNAPKPVPPGLDGPTLGGSAVAEQSPDEPEPDARPTPVAVELSPLRIAEPEPEPEPEEAEPELEPQPELAAFEPQEPEPEPEPEPTAFEAPDPATEAESPLLEPAEVEASEPAPEPIQLTESPSPAEPEHEESELTEEPVAVAPTIVPEPPAPADERPEPPAVEPEPVQPAAVEPEPVQPAAVEPEPVQPAAVEPASPIETPLPPAQPPLAAPPDTDLEPDPIPAPALHAVEPPTPDVVPQLRPPAPPEPTPPAAEVLETPAEPVSAEPAPASGAERHEVVVRLAEGEVVNAGTFSSRDAAKDAAKSLTRQIASSPPGEWPEIGGRFVRPELIVSVDIAD